MVHFSLNEVKSLPGQSLPVENKVYKWICGTNRAEPFLNTIHPD